MYLYTFSPLWLTKKKVKLSGVTEQTVKPGSGLEKIVISALLTFLDSEAEELTGSSPHRFHI